MEEVKSNDIKVEAPVITDVFIQEGGEDKKETVEPVDFVSRIIESHDKVSREVTKEDIPRVMEEAKILFNLCFTVIGRYQGGFALAHPQIDDKDPLRFFVTYDEKIIINPVMTRHTRHFVDSKEGCLSFSHLTMKIIDRFHRSEWDYQTIDPETQELTPVLHEELSGKDSFIWQHETDHLDAKYIYPIEMNLSKIKEDAIEIERKTKELKDAKKVGKKEYELGS